MAPEADQQAAIHSLPPPAADAPAAPTVALPAEPPSPLPLPAELEAAPPAAAATATASATATAPPQPSPRPVVAIIIDDMGYNPQLDRQFVQMETLSRLSFSFLPHAPYAGELAQLARAAGRDILVHLPMEPKDAHMRLEPETLLATDSAEEIRRKVEEMLAAIPDAAGASNHMGSLFSASGQRMRVVLETLKAHDLYFVDAFTTPGSQGLAVARQLGLPSARRHLFLDNEREIGAICRQLRQLAALAEQQGEAVGIGHPNQAMLAALDQCGGAALHAVDLVGVSGLVR